MIDYESYKKIQEWYELGLSIRKIAQKLNLANATVKRWTTIPEAEYFELQKTRAHYLDNYKEFFLEQLRICPQIKTTNLFYKTKENFSDFDCPRTAFSRYIKALREDYGYSRFFGRQTEPRDALPPGYEAQVDFGQSKLLDMYGRTVRVYFFCMILSYSRMKFVYFSNEPFTTRTAIKAHDYAFRYFGGRTQTIMYDQDQVFVVSENLGNIIFVSEFEDYVKEAGFSVVLCRPRDPQTKGKVENFVKYVKENFIEGRIFTGIDSFNSAAIAWLDAEANCRVHSETKRAPRVMFLEEEKKLQKVKPMTEFMNNIRRVNDMYEVVYKTNRYQLDRNLVKFREAIRIEEKEDKLFFYRAKSDELIYECARLKDRGERQKTAPSTEDEKTTLIRLLDILDETEVVHEFLEAFKKGTKRYKVAHYRQIIKLTNGFLEDEIEEAMEYCIKNNRCTAHELCAYLIVRHGSGRVKMFTTNYTFNQINKRAKEIQEEMKCQG